MGIPIFRKPKQEEEEFVEEDESFEEGEQVTEDEMHRLNKKTSSKRTEVEHPEEPEETKEPELQGATMKISVKDFTQLRDDLIYHKGKVDAYEFMLKEEQK